MGISIASNQLVDQTQINQNNISPASATQSATPRGSSIIYNNGTIEIQDPTLESLESDSDTYQIINTNSSFLKLVKRYIYLDRVKISSNEALAINEYVDLWKQNEQNINSYIKTLIGFRNNGTTYYYNNKKYYIWVKVQDSSDNDFNQYVEDIKYILTTEVNFFNKDFVNNLEKEEINLIYPIKYCLNEDKTLIEYDNNYRSDFFVFKYNSNASNDSNQSIFGKVNNTYFGYVDMPKDTNYINYYPNEVVGNIENYALNNTYVPGHLYHEQISNNSTYINNTSNKYTLIDANQVAYNVQIDNYGTIKTYLDLLKFVYMIDCLNQLLVIRINVLSQKIRNISL